MAEAPEDGEKTLDPTPKKLADVRKNGDVPKSTDISASAAFLGLILALTVLGPTSLLEAADKLTDYVANPEQLLINGSSFDASSISSIIFSVSSFFLLPLMLAPAAAVLLSLVAQKAIVFSPSKLSPKVSRISPITSAKNKFGAAGLFEFSKSAIKLLIVCVIMYWFLKKSLPDILLTLDLEPVQMTLILGNGIISFLLLVFVVSLIVGGGDYLWQLSEHLRKNRMSRKEVEDENKESEGDPHNKQARRQRGYEIAMNQMLSDIPQATVVIVNPTHYAVALKWSIHSGSAPICIAKGVDEIAARIREVATKHAIPIYSDPPTARALFSKIKVGEEIQSDDYQAVAAAIRFTRSMSSLAERSK
ncbi:EscU/YscU/HrcU family type III secretion system export apparatus switch protein [Litoreibacter arenae]|uniref:Flagellar biosynthesis protein FlhB n=1 Tax=Litoreibacter arenae DSM 19593 TaxID=1123360 RepID=S9QCJ7_9RHOB|nr:flagellar type III secretion system protein FlhB [Litoreibacter arenae]EPX77328.1 Flagellar biosynthesis protein FlhB [Litoreibacter arenae DSM 19593]